MFSSADLNPVQLIVNNKMIQLLLMVEALALPVVKLSRKVIINLTHQLVGFTADSEVVV